MTLIHGKIPLAHNKYFEIEVNKWGWPEASWFVAALRWTRCRDHAGMELELEVMSLCFRAVAYDVRHWNYDLGTWETHQTSSGQDEDEEENRVGEHDAKTDPPDTDRLVRCYTKGQPSIGKYREKLWLQIRDDDYFVICDPPHSWSEMPW